MIIETSVFVKLESGKTEIIYLPSFDCDFEKSYKEAFPGKKAARLDALQAVMELVEEKPYLYLIDIERIEVVYECEFGCKSYTVNFK